MKKKDPLDFIPYLLTEDLYFIPEKEPVVIHESVQKKGGALPERKQEVLVIIDQEELDSGDKQYLEKILTAVGLDLNSVDIVKDSDDLMSYKKILCFNSELDDTHERYSIVSRENSMLVYADSIKEISLLG